MRSEASTHTEQPRSVEVIIKFLNMAIMSDFRPSLLSHSSHDDAEFILYQPSPTKQLLLHDMATSSSVLTFLKMRGIQTTIKSQTNAEFMSVNGRLPVVIERDNDIPMCGFSQVFWRVIRKQSYTPNLLELAYMDWVDLNFLEAELYICWCYGQVVQDYTKPRYTHDLPWPVSSILFNKKRVEIMENVGIKYKNFDEFMEKFNEFMTTLNKRIGNKRYCLGSEPSSVDALIYGHVNAISSSNLDPKLLNVITKQRRVMNIRQVIHELYPS